MKTQIRDGVTYDIPEGMDCELASLILSTPLFDVPERQYWLDTVP